MYIISFIFINSENNQLLTKTPLVLYNTSLSNIILELRNIIGGGTLFNICNRMNIPIINLEIGLSTIYKSTNITNLHYFNIKLEDIRETKKIIKQKTIK